MRTFYIILTLFCFTILDVAMYKFEEENNRIFPFYASHSDDDFNDVSFEFDEDSFSEEPALDDEDLENFEEIDEEEFFKKEREDIDSEEEPEFLSDDFIPEIDDQFVDDEDIGEDFDDDFDLDR